jgi:hypothetical protein
MDTPNISIDAVGKLDVLPPGGPAGLERPGTDPPEPPARGRFESDPQIV